MLHHKLGTNALLLFLTAGAVLCYAAFVLYGAWIDGRRQKLHVQGKHPFTTDDGRVTSREDEEQQHG